jgi:outer membrane protein X
MRKNIILALLIVMTVLGAHAEAGRFSVGGQFSYASKRSMAGLGVQLQYEPVTDLRLAPEFIYYFENDGLSASNVNVNIHYVIPTSSSFALYPLAGFSYAHYKADTWLVGGSMNRCGANVGLGAQYLIKEHLHFFTEQRFQIIKDFNQSVTLLGLKYTF